MPVIVFHGTADTRVHPINADQIITQWSTTNARLAAAQQDAGFNLSEKIEDRQIPDGHSYRKHVYVDDSGNLVMEKWTVHGMGHAWSGCPKPHKYGDAKGPNASDELWRFFCETSQNSTVTSSPHDLGKAAD